MIKIKGVAGASAGNAEEHNKPKTKRHKTDHKYFANQFASCTVRPFLDVRVISGYFTITKDSRAISIQQREFRKALRACDPWGRSRTGNVAYKVVCSPTDATQGFLVALAGSRLQQGLVDIVQERVVHDVFFSWGSGCCLCLDGHTDTTRLHWEALVAKHRLDGSRVRTGFTWDRPWLTGIACRKAAGLPEDRDGPKHPRWNTKVGVQLEKDLIQICREFYIAHGIDEQLAKDATIRLQTTDRSEMGKARSVVAKEWTAERKVGNPITASALENGCQAIARLGTPSEGVRDGHFLKPDFIARAIVGAARRPDLRAFVDDFLRDLGTYFAEKKQAPDSTKKKETVSSSLILWDEIGKLLAWPGGDLELRLKRYEEEKQRWFYRQQVLEEMVKNEPQKEIAATQHAIGSTREHGPSI